MGRIGGAITVAVFGLLLGTPFLLRPPEEVPPADAVRVTIVSPHPEEVRCEFARAFADWHARTFPGERPAVIEWRSIGGTSDIVRFIRSEFASVFPRSYSGPLPGEQWNDERAITLLEKSADAGERKRGGELRTARTAWLAGTAGIDIDLFFGGGDFEHARLADAGYLVPIRLPAPLLAELPAELRQGKPWRLAGNDLADPKPDAAGGRRWYGTCLSAFGIVYSPIWHQAHGLPAPAAWADLAKPEYFGWLAAADPSKSGSAMKCFEMILQQQMAAAARRGQAGPVEAGWQAAAGLITRIGGNARYLSDQAPRVPTDVSAGEACVGMAIDFYGRAQELTAGADRIRYVHPAGGTVLSADPVAVLRGAPHRLHAERFVQFCLSREAQRLWYLPPRTGRNAVTAYPDGRPVPASLVRPERFALRRTPIRPDVFGDADYRTLAMDPYDPFAPAAGLMSYDGRTTGPLFTLLKDVYLPAMLVDARDELRDAWRALLDAGRPPHLIAEFDKPLLTWAQLEAAGRALRGSDRPYAEAAFLQREAWVRAFQGKFREIARRARGE